MIKKCTCKHKYQDKLYGDFHRMMNICQGAKEVRCTVCNAIHKI